MRIVDLPLATSGRSCVADRVDDDLAGIARLVM